jgi:5-hydroxyisourate hydrolase
MSTVSTHVLDTVTGRPAAGMLVRLEHVGVGELGRAVTDDDGRIDGFGAGSLGAGTYRLIFETEPYLQAAMAAGQGERDWPGQLGQPGQPGRAASEAFFPEVIVTFWVDGSRPKYHVPLLLSPYSYATYRGS